MKVLAILLVVGSLALCLQSHAAEKGKLTSIQGVAAKTEAKLNTAGVNSTDELLEKGGTPGAARSWRRRAAFRAHRSSNL